MDQIKTIKDLISSFKLYPSIGSKTAERLAYATLSLSDNERENFINALDQVSKLKKCPTCGMYINDGCPICSDNERDKETILVVADSKDIFSIEKDGIYKGLYFALSGTISPIKNRMPENIGIDQLEKRVIDGNIKEVILALPTDLDGETTALYIEKIFHDKDVVVSKIANGIPIGTSLEYLDSYTLKSSIQGRRNMKEEKE